MQRSIETNGKPRLRALLRCATQADHDAIHGNPMLSRLARAALTRAEYRDLMLRYLGFFQSLDPLLRAASTAMIPSGVDFRYQSRSDIIRTELISLGASRSALQHVAVCRDHAPIEDHASLIGALYVVEGSTLGGRLLSCQVDTILGGGPGGGYWQWCRTHGSDRWRGALRLIDWIDRSDNDAETAVRAARSTFRVLDNWLTSPAVRVPGLINV